MASVDLHDRTADRKPDADAAALGGEEGLEQPVCVIAGNTNAAIRHTCEHVPCAVEAWSQASRNS